MDGIRSVALVTALSLANVAVAAEVVQRVEAVPVGAPTIVPGPGPGPNGYPPPGYAGGYGPPGVVGPGAYGAYEVHQFVPRVASIQLQIGGSDYTGQIGRYTLIGPAYGVSFSVHPVRFLGFEMGYEGARNALDTLRYPQFAPASFWRNGGIARIKLFVPWDEIRPFVAAGFGLSYISVTGSDGGGRFHGDFVGQIPISAGIEIQSHGWVAGLRATYQFLMDAGFITNSVGQPEVGGILDVQATLGARF